MVLERDVIIVEDCWEGVMSHIGWGGEQCTIYTSVETFSRRVLKLRGKARKRRLKEEISARWVWILTNGIRVKHETVC